LVPAAEPRVAAAAAAAAAAAVAAAAVAVAAVAVAVAAAGAAGADVPDFVVTSCSRTRLSVVVALVRTGRRVALLQCPAHVSFLFFVIGEGGQF
jgi:hypothetical protein